MPEDYGLIPNNILQRYIFGTIVSGGTIEEHNSSGFPPIYFNVFFEY